MKKKGHITIVNICFIITCAAILIFLLWAPEETTSKLPEDQNHSRFFSIKSKKEAEIYCSECHSQEKSAPLPQEHPPKYRCLFCHKR